MDPLAIFMLVLFAAFGAVISGAFGCAAQWGLVQVALKKKDWRGYVLAGLFVLGLTGFLTWFSEMIAEQLGGISGPTVFLGGIVCALTGFAIVQDKSK